MVVGNLNCVLYILAEACGLGSKGIKVHDHCKCRISVNAKVLWQIALHSSFTLYG